MDSTRHTNMYRTFVAAAAIVGMLLPAATIVLTDAGTALATITPSSATDANFCSDYGEASNGSYLGVKACNGPYRGGIWFRGNGGVGIESDTVGFQCVELATRYLYAERGWPVQMVNGAALVRAYGAAHGIAPIQSGNASGLTPAVGDVISFSVESNFTDYYGVYPGHVAIVVAKTSTYIKILSENWRGQSAITQLSLSGTRVQAIATEDSSGHLVNTPYVEWLRMGTPVAPPAPASYGPYSVIGTGSNGLNERATPSTSGTLVGHLANGTTIYLACQIAGAAYSTGGTPATDSIWDKLTNGAYVADYWVSTPYVGTFSPGIPRC